MRACSGRDCARPAAPGDSLKRISRRRKAGRSGAPWPAARPVDAPAAVAGRRRDEPRIATGLEELDRVLGGGLVLGSVTLLGGDPGIGKSTMLLQAGDALSRATPTLYVTGEESLRQVSLRARRLGVVSDTLQLLAETSVDTIIEHAQRTRRARARHRFDSDHVRARRGVLAGLGLAGARSRPRRWCASPKPPASRC